MSAPGRRVLVAGIGNVFLGDDGFGVEVVGRIDASALPATVDVADYGIRGVHLAYELLDGRHDTLIMVDAVPLDGPPGTLAVLEVDPPTGPEPPPPPALDGHGMDPEAVLGLLRAIGGDVDRVLVVGCRPAVIEERMGLSEPVRAVVDDAVSLVTELACEEATKPGRAERRPADA
ncbi:hydrogenase maturation protease [Actinoallomurus vinaceus]|uniref:Hydrogenase maturation protease n=1 Tax=Actinoallomurus vinaceus TaxID=1080074 RepID=A0ABP8UGZ2_9ACTN